MTLREPLLDFIGQWISISVDEGMSVVYYHGILLRVKEEWIAFSGVGEEYQPVEMYILLDCITRFSPDTPALIETKEQVAFRALQLMQVLE